MVVMEEHRVKRFLDDLLIRLEVFGDDEETRSTLSGEFVRVLNFYKDAHQSLMEEYRIKGNEIMKRYE